MPHLYILNKWFIMLLMLGTIITISSNNWLNCWMGLEMNLMAFIPFLYKMMKFKSIESSLIYFLFQSYASLVFLFSIIMLLMKFINLVSLMNNLLIFSLMIKIGSAPLHFWMLLVLENLGWMKSLILMTWQKIAPFILLMNCLNYKFIYLFIIFSSFFGSIMGLNQISLQKIMGYSSINHISWMLSSMVIKKTIWINYFMFYLMILTSVIFIFYKFNLYFLNQFFLIFKNYSLKLMLFMNLLSMGGLPPFLGFFPKFMVIKILTNKNYFVLNFILIIFMLIILFFYLRIIYFTLLINSTNLKNYFILNYQNKFIFYLSNLNNILLIIFMMML